VNRNNMSYVHYVIGFYRCEDRLNIHLLRSPEHGGIVCDGSDSFNGYCHEPVESRRISG
jgi:hypothetical protein